MFVCYAVISKHDDEFNLKIKSALSGEVDPQYREGAAFLREIGFEGQAEIARVLDIAMNPHSMFVTFRDKKRAINASARKLTVQHDMRPVTDFLRAQGLSQSQIVKMVADHPPVLGYDVEQRLRPFWQYLESLGVEDVNSVLVSRSSLLGLDVDANLKKIVDYLIENEYSKEDIVKYVSTSL